MIGAAVFRGPLSSARMAAVSSFVAVLLCVGSVVVLGVEKAEAVETVPLYEGVGVAVLVGGG